MSTSSRSKGAIRMMYLRMVGQLVLNQSQMFAQISRQSMPDKLAGPSYGLRREASIWDCKRTSLRGSWHTSCTASHSSLVTWARRACRLIRRASLRCLRFIGSHLLKCLDIFDIFDCYIFDFSVNDHKNLIIHKQVFFILLYFVFKY